MRPTDLVRWPLAVVYILALSILAFLLIAIGALMRHLRWLPTRIERWYADQFLILLDLLIRPVDRLLPRVEDAHKPG